jgi:hypothetical protein
VSAAAGLERSGLVDLLDRLLDTGVAATGDVTLAVAGVDLVHLQLRALLASVEAELREPGEPRQELEWLAPRRHRRGGAERLPDRIDADPKSLERGLAQLVLVVVDLLRELMERQAIRRLQAGSLTDAETARLGSGFAALDDRIERLFADLT